jgi:16S rRNA processing protein RimM
MAEQADRNDRKVCIGVIAGAHGVSGLVRLKSFTADPEAVAAYGPLTDASGRRRFRIELTGAARDMLLARIEGVTDRTAAEALRGVELHVERGRLPAPEADEFYHTDLIGLPARAVDGSEIGTVTAFYDYGAGDMIEIRAAGGRVDLLPFTKAVVPQVDLERGFVVIAPPSETYARPEDERPEDERVGAGV